MKYLSVTEACKILGVKSSASENEIQKRWRILARKYHPDLNQNNPDAKKRFKKYRDAYEVLNTFRSGSKAVAALEDEALDSEFDTWLDNLGITGEKRKKIKEELNDLGIDE